MARKSNACGIGAGRVAVTSPPSRANRLNLALGPDDQPDGPTYESRDDEVAVDDRHRCDS